MRLWSLFIRKLFNFNLFLYNKFSYFSKFFTYFSPKKAAVAKKAIDLERNYYMVMYSAKICSYPASVLVKIDKKCDKIDDFWIFARCQGRC